MNDQIVSVVVGTVLSGGLGAAIYQIANARAELRRVRIEEHKAGPEAESILLGGAERAVASLQAALDRAEYSITRLEQLLEKREKRVAELERELDSAKSRLGVVQSRLADFDQRISGLEEEEK